MSDPKKRTRGQVPMSPPPRNPKRKPPQMHQVTPAPSARENESNPFLADLLVEEAQDLSETVFHLFVPDLFDSND